MERLFSSGKSIACATGLQTAKALAAMSRTLDEGQRRSFRQVPQLEATSMHKLGRLKSLEDSSVANKQH